MPQYIPCSDETVRRIPWELLPQLPAVGGFQFPDPWLSYATRVTTDEQGKLLEPVGYSYWRNINAHKDRDFLTIMLAFRDVGPCIFTIKKDDGAPKFIKPLDIHHTGEGLYFSAHYPNILYGAVDNTFYRFNIETGQAAVVFSEQLEHYLWQCNSNFDETVHSATLRDKATYNMLGAVVYNETTKQRFFFPAIGEFDECQIDHSGKHLLIKETYANGSGESNRIINLDNLDISTISDKDGAVGHSDMGYKYVVGEVDVDPAPNAVEMMSLLNFKRTLQYYGTQWSTGVGHVSHTNIHNPDFMVISNAGDESVPRQAEIIQVPLDGSQTFRPLAPSMVDLNQGDRYRNMPKGNLCPYGEYFIWTANHRSDHLDAFILKL